MQKNLVETLNPGSKRTSKRSEGVYLLEHITCPGVLIECGFLSNLQEEAMLRSESYQKKLCCVMVSSLSSYLQTGRRI